MAITNQLGALFEPKLQAWMQSERVTEYSHSLLFLVHPNKSRTYVLIPNADIGLMHNNATLPDLILRYPNMTMSLEDAIKPCS